VGNTEIFCLQLALLLVLVILSAFFSGSETALFSLSRARLLSYRNHSVLSRRRIAALMLTYHRTLIALVLGNMFVNIGTSIVGSEMLSRFGGNPLVSTLAAIVMTIILLLIVGEITPKTIALRHAERISRCVAGIVWYFRLLLFPLIRVTEAVFAVILNILGRKKSAPLQPEEYDSYLEMAYTIGAFSDEETKLLTNVFALRQINVNRIMRGRIDVPCVKTTMAVDEITKLIRDSRQPFFPVIKEDLDDAESFLSARDFFAVKPEQRSVKPDCHGIFPAVFIPENAALTHALATLKENALPIALVTDEYGGIVGTIDQKSIYEEIVGDIEGEYEIPDWQVKRLGPASWELNGQITLGELRELLSWEVPETDAITLNGLVTELLDRLPEPGDRVEVNGIAIVVSQLSGKRINVAEIHLLRARVEIPEEGQGSSL